jgi:hypothetical protein
MIANVGRVEERIGIPYFFGSGLKIEPKTASRELSRESHISVHGKKQQKTGDPRTIPPFRLCRLMRKAKPIRSSRMCEKT